MKYCKWVYVDLSHLYMYKFIYICPSYIHIVIIVHFGGAASFPTTGSPAANRLPQPLGWVPTMQRQRFARWGTKQRLVGCELGGGTVGEF